MKYSERVAGCLIIAVVLACAGCLEPGQQQPGDIDVPLQCSETIGPGQQKILNESQNNCEICASKSGTLVIQLTGGSRIGEEWSLTTSDGLLLSDEGTVWYDEKGIPTNISGLGKGIHSWNVVMNGSGTQTIDAILTHPGRENPAPVQTYHYTIIISP